jgi:hypothetical protein
MLRKVRIDSPRALHHIIPRGIARKAEWEAYNLTYVRLLSSPLAMFST